MDIITQSNLEHDLLRSEYIKGKCVDSLVYSQNLYAALCNNTFIKNEEEWSCTWRCAAGIVADIRLQNEDYLDWYCSGMWLDRQGVVREGIVTDKIRADIEQLGWKIIQN